MNPALSRRVGALMLRPAVRKLGVVRHLALVHAVDAAASFDDLPRWVQAVVLAAEREQASLSEPRPAEPGGSRRPQ